MSEYPDFAEFFHALHGIQPFPWQRRLAEQVRAEGWPEDIGIPTGLGKTATIDIAVWAMAAEADLPAHERRVPRRIWYVVDRRLLVDAASDRSDAISSALANPHHPAIAAVAQRLRRLSGSPASSPLYVSRMRGGSVSPDIPFGLPPDPAQPAVVCATVAMYASRLLFRGFGVSRLMWPVHAAHAGIDSLVLLDEAHLARPLQRLMARIPPCDANQSGILRFPGRFEPTAGPKLLLPPERTYPQLVNLTATGNPGAFDLDDQDLANATIRQRITAAKPTRLVTATSASQLPVVLAEELRAELAKRSADTAAVVFVNDPHTARQVSTVLRRASLSPVTLTGQLREPEAETVRRALLDPGTGAPAGKRHPRDTPLVVVATQTLEVGADLDFDVCISELAGTRAIVQRWGRLNRLGQKPDATGVLVYAPGRRGLYGEEPEKLWQRLQSVSVGTLDLGPTMIADVLGPPVDDVAGEGQLLPNHLWEFAKTTTSPSGAAPPDVFFDNLPDDERRVTVLWRSTLPAAGQALDPPVASGEILDLPIAAVRDFLVHGEKEFAVLADDAATAQPTRELALLRPGVIVALRADCGGYGSDGWDPDDRTTAQVLDLSPRFRGTLHLSEVALANLFLESNVTATSTEAVFDALGELQVHDALTREADGAFDPATDRSLGNRIIQELRHAGLGTCLPGLETAQLERVGEEQLPVLRWRLPKRGTVSRVEAFDELSNLPSQDLTAHQESVGELAGRFANTLGLPPEVRAALQHSGQMHDVGKSDPRFQRWLQTPDGAAPRAKSDLPQSRWQQARVASGWPSGARHERLSAQLVDHAERLGLEVPEGDLVRHLILSHHGHGRPLSPPASETAPATTHAEVKGLAVRCVTDPGRADWGEPDRFRALCERYGYWGLALLEAILRQADHRVSAATDRAAVTGAPGDLSSATPLEVI